MNPRLHDFRKRQEMKKSENLKISQHHVLLKSFFISRIMM